MSETEGYNDALDEVSKAHQATLYVGKLLAVRSVSKFGSIPRTIVFKRDEAFAVTTQLEEARAFKMFRDGALVSAGHLSKAALLIHDLSSEWTWRFGSDFDLVTFHIPFSRVRGFATSTGQPQFTNLGCEPNVVDEVVRGIAQSLVFQMDMPLEISPLFLEQLELALLAHLAQNYGGVHFPIKKKGTLNSAQQQQATEFLTGHFNSPFTMTALAESCDLSRSYFMKAFKETFGKTPHRWLTEYRVELAKEKLLLEISIAEIAAFCGFSDQSHLSRVFSDVTGISPGAWRRQNRAMPRPI